MTKLLKTLFILTLVSFSQAALKNLSKIGKLPKKFESVPHVKTPIKNFSPEEYSLAWSRAATIDHRNPKIWRLDENNNIIMSENFTKGSPISFYVVEDGHSVKAKLNKFATPWVFEPNHEILMNIIEIAVIGFISDENDHPVCWTPSKIHYDFCSNSPFNKESEQWVSTIQDSADLGLMGHINIFKPMGVFLRKYPGYRTTVGGTPNNTCAKYVISFAPHKPAAVVPDYDEEVEGGKTDSAAACSTNTEATEMTPEDLSRLNNLTDEQFERLFGIEQWVAPGEPGSAKKSKQSSSSSKSNTGSGKTNSALSSGGSTVASIDGSKAKVHKLVKGAHGKK